jgi:hypothetical protein
MSNTIPIGSIYTASNAIAIGGNAIAIVGSNSIAIGRHAIAIGGSNSIAIGRHAMAYGPLIWKMQYGTMRNTGDKVIGIFSNPVVNTFFGTPRYTLWLPDHEQPFQRLNMDDLPQIEYDTHVAFETFPILEMVKDHNSKILLKFPD